jgi:hypothetical protein
MYFLIKWQKQNTKMKRTRYGTARYGSNTSFGFRECELTRHCPETDPVQDVPWAYLRNPPNPERERVQERGKAQDPILHLGRSEYLSFARTG